MVKEKPRKYSQVENLMPLKLNFKLVPHASDRHDVIGISAQILSEHLDMGIDRAIVFIIVSFPDR